MVTKVCGSLLNSNVLVVPLDQREARQFDGRILISGAANAFPEQLKAALSNWEELMVDQEVSTDVVLDLITPYYQVHYREICELSCYRHLRTEVDRMVLNSWDTCGE